MQKRRGRKDQARRGGGEEGRTLTPSLSPLRGGTGPGNGGGPHGRSRETPSLFFFIRVRRGGPFGSVACGGGGAGWGGRGVGEGLGHLAGAGGGGGRPGPGGGAAGAGPRDRGPRRGGNHPAPAPRR